MKKTTKQADFTFLSFWQAPGARVWTKSIALLISLAFLLPCLSWAFDGSIYSAPQPLTMVQHLGKALSLPEKFGRIKQGFQGNGKLIVHIQDLHCNYEVQMNISRTIHHLAAKHGLRLVGEEGAFHTVNTAKISTFPLKKVREEVSDYFVRQGKLTGAEFYAGTGEYPIHLEGIETPALYHASMEAVHSFLNFESQGYCYDLRETLDELKTSVYNPRLRKFDAKRMAWREGDLELLKYCGHLQAAARAHLNPHFEKGGKGGIFSSYPNFSRFLSLKQDYFSKEIDSDQLFQEMDILDIAIRQNLYANQAERELDMLYRRLDIIEKLLNISAAPRDLREFRARPQDFVVRIFMDFIREQDATGECLLDPEIHRLDEYLNQVKKFYQLADERSQHFVANLCRKMEARNEKLAIMITGGFHTAEVLQEMQSRDISYVSITPSLTRQDVVNPYFSLLRNKKMPLEKLLSKNQEIMAVLTACPDLPDIKTNQVLPISKIKSLTRQAFARMQGLLLKNATIVTLVDDEGIETEDIPVNLEKILKIYPANDRELRLDVEAFLRVNTDILTRLGGKVIPMLAGSEEITSIVCSEDSTAPNPDLVASTMQIIEIKGSKFYFYNTGDISDLIKLLAQNRKSPSLLFLPEMSWWNMLGFLGLTARLAWTAGRTEKLPKLYASAKAFALRIPAWAARIPALFQGRLKTQDFLPAGLIGKYRPLETPEYNPDEGVISFRAKHIETGEEKEVVIEAEVYTETEAVKACILRIFKTENKLAKAIMDWFFDEGLKKPIYLLDSKNLYGIHGLATKEMIAVSQDYKNEPLAWFHEIAEAMGAAGSLRYDKILENLADQRWYDRHLDKPGRKGLELHYAIRALQREAFGEQDRALEDKIKGWLKNSDVIKIIEQAEVPINPTLVLFMNKRKLFPSKEAERLYLDQLLAEARKRKAEQKNAEHKAGELEKQIENILSQAEEIINNRPGGSEAGQYHTEADKCLTALDGLDNEKVIEVMTEKIRTLSQKSYYFSINDFYSYLTGPALLDRNPEVITGVLSKLVHMTLNSQRGNNNELLKVLRKLLEACQDFSQADLELISIPLQQGLRESFKEEVFVDSGLVEDIPDYKEYFKLDGKTNRAYFKDGFQWEIRRLRDEKHFERLWLLYKDKHFRRDSTLEIYQILMSKDQTGYLKKNLLDSLEKMSVNLLPLTDRKGQLMRSMLRPPEKETYTEDAKCVMVKLLAKSLQQNANDAIEGIDKDIDRLSRIIITICKDSGVSDNTREDLIANLAKISGLITTPEVQQTVFEFVEAGLNEQVERANYFCNMWGKRYKEYKMLDENMERFNNRLRILSFLAENSSNQNILRYIMEIAGNETWHSNIISEIASCLEKHIQSDNPEIIKFYLEQLESRENHDAINKIISGNQDNFFSGELEINERSRYLIVLSHQENQEFLKKIILSEMDIKFRLHAFLYYMANFGEDADETELRKIYHALEGDGEKDQVKALLEQVVKDNDKIKKMFNAPWLQDEEAKVYIVAAMLDVRKNHPAILTSQGIQSIAKRIMYAEIHRFSAECNDRFYFGGKQLRMTEKPAEIFFQIIIHELGHNILKKVLGFETGGKIKNGVLHEHWSDHVAADFASRFGLDFGETEKLMGSEREYEDVSGDGFKTIEEHEGARAQSIIIQKELSARGMVLDHGKYIETAFEVLKEKNNRLKTLDEIIRLFLAAYLEIDPFVGEESGTAFLRKFDIGKGTEMIMQGPFVPRLKELLLNPDKIRELLQKYFSIAQELDASAQELGKGVIPIGRKLLVERWRICSGDTYDNYIAPLLEEVVFTGVPIIISMFSPLPFVPVFLVFRLAFILLHLFGARAPDGKTLVRSNWYKSWTGILLKAKAITPQLTWPTLLSAAVFIVFVLVSPTWTGLALAILMHYIVNRWLQPFLNQELKKRGIEFCFGKAALSKIITDGQKQQGKIASELEKVGFETTPELISYVIDLPDFSLEEMIEVIRTAGEWKNTYFKEGKISPEELMGLLAYKLVLEKAAEGQDVDISKWVMRLLKDSTPEICAGILKTAKELVEEWIPLDVIMKILEKNPDTWRGEVLAWCIKNKKVNPLYSDIVRKQFKGQEEELRAAEIQITHGLSPEPAKNIAKLPRTAQGSAIAALKKKKAPPKPANLLAREGVKPFIGAALLAVAAFPASWPALTTAAFVLMGFLGIRTVLTGVLEQLIHGRFLSGETDEPGLVHGVDGKIRFNLQIPEEFSFRKKNLIKILLLPFLISSSLHEGIHKKFSSEIMAYGLESAIILAVLMLPSALFWLSALIGLFLIARVIMGRDVMFKRGDTTSIFAALFLVLAVGISTSMGHTGPGQSEKIDEIIKNIWAENRKGNFPKGINLLAYKKKHGEFAIYYLIKDIEGKIEYEGKMSPQYLPETINGIIGKTEYKRQFVPVKRFFVIIQFLRDKLNAGKLVNYGDPSGEGLARLVEEVEMPGSLYADMRGINIGHLTGILNSSSKVAGILGIDSGNDQLSNWKMPYVNVTWKQFEAIREILKKKLETDTLSGYGDEGGEGLAKLLGEIERNNAYMELRGINVGSLTGLINSSSKVAGILGIDPGNDQLSNWNMPYVNVTWKQFEVIQAILHEKLEARTLSGYGDEGGEGLAKLLGEIEGNNAYMELRGINIGSLTGLINSSSKVAGILGIRPEHEQLSNWNMPYVNGTWKQFKAIRVILEEKLEARTLAGYGDEGGEGLAKLLGEIERNNAYMELRGINIGSLTSLINSSRKVAGILGIDPGNDQLSNWNMPYVNVTWKQFEAIRKILNKKLGTDTLSRYGDEGGEGLVKLLGEIESGEKAYAELRGINIGNLTGLINSSSKVAGILGIDPGNGQLINWNMPYVDVTWKQFEEIQEILHEKLEASILAGYGDKGGEGLVKLLGEIERNNAYMELRGINIGHLTGILNSSSKVAGILGIDPGNGQLINWNMPRVNMTWEQFKAIRVILEEKLEDCTLAGYGDEGGEGLVKLLGEIESGEKAYVELRGINIGHLTGILNASSKVAGILGIRPEHEQLSNWNMPIVNMTWKQFKVIKEILEEKLEDCTLAGYGDEGGEGLAALLSEIKKGDGVYAVLQGINIGHLTSLLNSPKKVAGIMGIDPRHDQLTNWKMPYVDMTWKQFMENQKQGAAPANLLALGKGIPTEILEAMPDASAREPGKGVIPPERKAADPIGGLMPWLMKWYVEQGMKKYAAANSGAVESALDKERGRLQAQYQRRAWLIEAVPLVIGGVAALTTAICIGWVDPSIGSSALVLTGIRLGWLVFPFIHLLPKSGGYKSFTRADWINVGISFGLAGINIAFSFTPVTLAGIILFGLVSHWMTNKMSSVMEESRKTSAQLMKLRDLLGEGESGEAYYAQHVIGKVVYKHIDTLFGPNFNLSDNIRVRVGWQFRVELQELNPGSTDVLAELANDDVAWVITIPFLFKGVLAELPEKEPFRVFGKLQSKLVGLVLENRMSDYEKATKAAIQTESQRDEKMYEIEYGGKIRNLLLRLLPGFGGSRQASGFYKSQGGRKLGVTGAEVFKFIEAARQASRPRTSSLWEAVEPQLRKLLADGNVPSSATLAQALIMTEADDIADSILRAAIAQMQRAIEAARKDPNPERLAIEVNHIAELIIRSRRGFGLAASLGQISQATQDAAKCDQVHLLMDKDSKKAMRQIVKDLMPEAGPAYQAALGFLETVLAAETINPTDSARLQALLQSIAMSEGQVAALPIGKGVRKYGGSMANGRVDVVKDLEFSGEKVEVAKPVVATLLVENAQVIKDLQDIEGLNAGTAQSQIIAVIPFNGRLPKLLPETGNFHKAIARYCVGSSVLEKHIGTEQPLAQAYFRLVNKETDINNRLLARVIIRLMKHEAGLLEKDAARQPDFDHAMAAVNEMFKKSRIFSSIEIGRQGNMPAHAPNTLRFGGYLGYIYLCQKTGDFVLNKDWDDKLRRIRLRNFRMGSAV